MKSRHRELLAVATVGGLGFITLAIHGYHLLVHDLSIAGIFFGALVPMGVSVGLLIAAGWLWATSFGTSALRVATWCLVGSVTLLAVGSMVTVFQYAMGTGVTDVWYVLVAHVSIGGLLGTIIGVYDTQRIRSELALRRERETADQLGSRLSVLNRVLRHDLRNSINVIQGNARLIADGEGDPSERAEVILSKTDEMMLLSERAREIEAALSEEAEIRQFDLAEVIRRSVSELKERNGDVQIDTEFDDGSSVESTPLVHTAIERLLENAIQHHDRADPCIWVEVTSTHRDGQDVALVRIADDGPGIPEEQIDVLERGRETPLEHSSGLGLWQVHWIVEKAGGQLRFGTRDPRGCVIELTIPRRAPTSG